MNEKLESMIRKHEGLIRKLENGTIDKNSPLFDHVMKRIKQTGKYLVLQEAKYKCEKCKSKTNLTFHHFIKRMEKNFISERKYWSLRHYYKNISILCSDCHDERDKMPDPDARRMSLKPEFIERVKKYFK